MQEKSEEIHEQNILIQSLKSLEADYKKEIQALKQDQKNAGFSLQEENLRLNREKQKMAKDLEYLERENQTMREKLQTHLDKEYKHQTSLEPFLKQKQIRESSEKFDELFSHSEEDMFADSQKVKGKEKKQEEQVNYLQLSDKQLFKSFQEPSEKKRDEDDLDTSHIDYYKELLSSVEVEKKKMQEELNHKIALLNEEIASLHKEQNENEILRQKSKIDELMKLQWKKESEEIKNKCQSLAEENQKLKNQCFELNKLNENLDMKYQEAILSLQQLEAEQ